MSVSLQAIPFKQAEPISFKRPLKTFIEEEYEEDEEFSENEKEEVNA